MTLLADMPHTLKTACFFVSREEIFTLLLTIVKLIQFSKLAVKLTKIDKNGRRVVIFAPPQGARFGGISKVSTFTTGSLFLSMLTTIRWIKLKLNFEDQDHAIEGNFVNTLQR
jgi:hypothetical protein